MNYFKLFVSVMITFITFQSCRPDTPIPKPTAYYKIDLPASHTYQKFDSIPFPYEFEYPAYGIISQDTNLIREEHAPYWVNVNIPTLNATIYISYKKIGPGQTVSQLIDESNNLSSKHNVRADYIDAQEYQTKYNNKGLFYTIGGNAASFYQFYVTDSVNNFIRGSLYFNATPNADSLQPAANFLKEDIEHLIQTIRFK